MLAFGLVCSMLRVGLWDGDWLDILRGALSVCLGWWLDWILENMSAEHEGQW